MTIDCFSVIFLIQRKESGYLYTYMYTKIKELLLLKKNYKKDKCMYTFFLIIENNNYKILRIIFL
jgi:hypothetical protein